MPDYSSDGESKSGTYYGLDNSIDMTNSFNNIQGKKKDENTSIFMVSNFQWLQTSKPASNGTFDYIPTPEIPSNFLHNVRINLNF